MGNVKLKQNTARLLILLIMLDVCYQCFGENVKFKVQKDLTALSCSKEIGEWKVRSNLECYMKCAVERDCIWAQFDVDLKMCKVVAESTSPVTVRFSSNAVVSEKVIAFLFAVYFLGGVWCRVL